MKHVKIQIYGVDFGKLKDVLVAERFLIAAIKAAGMRALDQPWVYDIREELEAQGEKLDPTEPEGVTGIVVLSTSHAAIHTWPHRGYAVFDLFSCTDFETEKVERVVQERYSPKRITVKDLSYSLELPPLPET